jgi:hypothetical protein
VAHDDEQPGEAERVAALGRGGDELLPDGSVVERLEPDELDERPEVVELVLDRRAGDGEPALGLEVATRPSGDRVGVLDEAA